MIPNQQTARETLRKLIDKFDALSNADRETMSEASVVRQFIDILLRDVLGWPIEDPARYKYELHTQGGRPDITLIPEAGGTVFVEAKRFGVIKPLEKLNVAAAAREISGLLQPRQLQLPGMATDRTKEEQQAINYAFENNGTWAILTNFERLRLFNARRDWLVLSFEKPNALLDEFESLWQLAYPNILNGSLDALSNQRWTEAVDTQYLNFINTQREALARDVVARRADNPWVLTADGQINLPLLRAVVQRFIDRLVIIRFAEDHLVLKNRPLYQFFELRDNLYRDSMDHILDKFFRKFNDEHNSALFAEDMADSAVFSDAALLPLIDTLYQARYRSMPADIMGNTYEQYLGKTLALDNGVVVTRDNLETRKKQGSYYTPQVIVRYIVDHSLGRYLYGTANGKADGEPVAGESRKTSADIRDLRLLDSACGSGSFLIYAYEVLAGFYEAEVRRWDGERGKLVAKMAADFANITLDDRIAAERVELEIKRLKDYPRIILENHLYGVDLDPQAAEIAVVNLMMRAMERQMYSIDKRLPLILNQNVKVGNSLIGLRPDDPRLSDQAETLAELRRLRAELIAVTHTDPRHDAILDELKAGREKLYAAFAADYAPHFSDVERVRPFHWGAEFPEVFYNEDGTLKENAGFAIIIGNPPWEIVKPDLREFYAQFDPLIESRYSRERAEQRIIELQAEQPQHEQAYQTQKTSIEQSAAYYRQNSDYRRQGRGDTATHKLFTERSWALLHDGGRLGYVVPSGIYTDLGTKDLREMLLNEGQIQYLYSFSNERYFFPGVDHRFKFCLLGGQKGVSSDGFWAAFRFNPRVAVSPDDLPAFLANRANLIYVRRESLEKFSPDSLSVMEFQNPRDYAVAEKIYGNHPLLGQEVEGAWHVRFTREFDMTNDRDLFVTTPPPAPPHRDGEGSRAPGAAGRGLLPLYEGKMIHQYDAFFAEPQYWVDEAKAAQRGRPNYASTRLAVRTIARTTDQRTLICTVLPPKSFCGHSILVSDAGITPDVQVYLQALLNCYVIDYIVRYKVATNVGIFQLYQLPVPRLTAGHPTFDALVPLAARLVCTRAEFAGLWESVMGTAYPTPLPPPHSQARREGESTDSLNSPPQSFGEGLEVGLPATTPAERQAIRDEIDARVALLYGLTRDEFNHILSTFPLVFPDTDAGRAKRAALLAAYDRIAAG